MTINNASEIDFENDDSETLLAGLMHDMPESEMHHGFLTMPLVAVLA